MATGEQAQVRLPKTKRYFIGAVRWDLTWTLPFCTLTTLLDAQESGTVGNGYSSKKTTVHCKRSVSTTWDLRSRRCIHQPRQHDVQFTPACRPSSPTPMVTQLFTNRKIQGIATTYSRYSTGTHEMSSPDDPTSHPSLRVADASAATGSLLLSKGSWQAARTSHLRIVVSDEPDTRKCPSRVNATD